jgi:DNA-binding MarR family transcriptional regulator
MDRTTLGRNILPLEREGLIAVKTGRADRRSKELHLTEAGAARLRIAAKGWAEAQAHFESAFGSGKAADMRTLMREITAIGQPQTPQRE